MITLGPHRSSGMIFPSQGQLVTILIPCATLRRRGWQRMRWWDKHLLHNGHESEQIGELVKDRGAWQAAVHGFSRVGHDLATE